jgi:agmatinase
VSTDAQKTVDITRLVVEDILAAGKMPVVLGGEHTITLGVAKGLGARAAKTAVIRFNAYLDLRCEFLGSTLSHTTFMQLISGGSEAGENLCGWHALSVQGETIFFQEGWGRVFFTSQQIIKQGSNRIAKQLKQ